MIFVIAEERVVELPRVLGMLCHDFTEVEVEVSVVPFLCSRMTEFNPEVAFRLPIEWFWCGGCARRNGQWRFCHYQRGGGIDLGHVVRRQVGGRRCERMVADATVTRTSALDTVTCVSSLDASRCSGGC